MAGLIDLDNSGMRLTALEQRRRYGWYSIAAERGGKAFAPLRISVGAAILAMSRGPRGRSEAARPVWHAKSKQKRGEEQCQSRLLSQCLLCLPRSLAPEMGMNEFERSHQREVNHER